LELSKVSTDSTKFAINLKKAFYSALLVIFSQAAGSGDSEFLREFSLSMSYHNLKDRIKLGELA
jgi:hypothetical protein